VEWAQPQREGPRAHTGAVRFVDAETLVKEVPKGLKVKTRIRAVLSAINHNETLVKEAPQSLKVKTKVRAGGMPFNHHELLVRDR
jgi:hypothetical protein